MVVIPSREQINSLMAERKKVDVKVRESIVALKEAMDKCLEMLNERENINLRMNMGKSTDQYCCLINDLEKLNSLIFSAFNHAGLSSGYM
jgi:hypothetical protein